MQGVTMHVATSKTPESNDLLAALPRGEYLKLARDLEPVTLTFGQVLYEPHSKIAYVYFPVTAMVSLLTSVDAARAAEVGLVGSEGMVGLPVALGIAESPFLAIVQGGGQALRMKASALRRHSAGNVALQRELFRFTHMLMTQVAQTAACNSFHVVTQRMARWLLMTRDRVHAREFPITQEFLARMLGVRRVGVSEAASSLQARRLITYSRGNLRILDERGLATAACSCYRTVKDLYQPAKRKPRSRPA